MRSTDSLTQEAIEALFRKESNRVLATLIRLLGSFDRAEEAMQEAFVAATEVWPRDGIPANPRAWLISTGRFKAIDAIRREERLERAQPDLIQRKEEIQIGNIAKSEEEIHDDRLRLIFTCCHPAIDPGIQVPLTLREVCGLKTEEIANAFLTSTATMAQRIVRGKAKIRDAGIPYIVPSAAELPERLDAVLAVTYLVYSEGYSASRGPSLVRTDLSEEAIRLGHMLVELIPDPEAIGLLALMLLQESRRNTRTNAEGDIVLLEDQDRTQWDSELIAQGQNLLQRAIATRRFGTYTLQAAIASEHARSATPQETDWKQIVRLYDALLSIHVSPIVELNRAVAVAMSEGPEAGLQIIETILDRGDLVDYHLAHAARADLDRRLERYSSARASYMRALSLATQEPERRFLQARLGSLPEFPL